LKRLCRARGFDELDVIAITAGPGSFTAGPESALQRLRELRLQIISCISVSTLDAIAHIFIDENAVICAVYGCPQNAVL
jgi:tRNA A37 threonylcarbamoyladenosine modification protein TsaB